MAVDGIIANGVTEILKKLSSVVANEITLVWDFNDELKNLQTTLSMILAVMEDAEKKEVGDGFVRLWMEELKYIAYDAEEILDDYSYEIIGKHTQTGKVSKPSLLFRRRMAHKIKKINEKLNKIAKRKNDLGLQTIDVGSSSSHNTMMMNRETYSLVVADWKIVGRENDKSKIINTVLDKDSCLVLSIVGLGGMGKTTMAQLVYNDEVVQKDFQIKIWICVSDPFDVKKLFKNIVNSIELGKNYDDVATMDDIAHRLQEAFRGKKFLLVLDDVWNESPEDWYKFKTPFMVGAEGSKILVTTRSVKVASIMVDKFPPYPLGILNDYDSWFLFKELAFGSGVGAVESLKLVEIGKTMVKRCGGLPLAVIFLGSLMRSKKTEEEWKNIRDTKIWHESHEGKKSKHRILPSLRLSYDNLPSHLKQCFSYCCLFPKDSAIQRKNLIQLWMAEGFLIKSPGENAMSMEEIGNEYFQNLLSNFFFQKIPIIEDRGSDAYTMHDLVHDLASSVVGKNECLIVENAHDIDSISEATFRLNLINVEEDMLAKVFEALKKAKNLRTVFVSYKSTSFDIGKAFDKNKRLRVLDLNGSNIINFPSSGLKYLRYLSLPSRFIIPKGIGHLRFLPSLEIFQLDDSYKNAGAGGIEELEYLNHLRGELHIYGLKYVPNGKAACRANLMEKKNLRNLNLSWGDVRYNNASAKSHEAVLKGLRPHPNLRTLGIDHFQGSRLPRWIFDSFCLPNLEHLTLDDGNYIEQVAGFGALPSLRSLTLMRLGKLECIGNEFYFSAAGGGGGRGGSSSSFPLLKYLTITSMDSLKEWVVPVPAQASTTTTGATTTTYCFPLLEEIHIYSCHQLSTITPTTTIFPSLKVLNLSFIDGSAAETLVTNNLNSLTSLKLIEIDNLITLPRQGLMENNNTLLSLEIIGCSDFKGFLPPKKDEEEEGHGDDQEVGVVGEGGGGGQQLLQQIAQVVSSSSCSSSSSSLQTLKLYHCPALRLFPNIHSLTSLRELVIIGCKEFLSLQGDLTCLSSSLEHLEHVKIRKIKTATEKAEVFEWRKPSSFKE